MAKRQAKPGPKCCGSKGQDGPAVNASEHEEVGAKRTACLHQRDIQRRSCVRGGLGRRPSLPCAGGAHALAEEGAAGLVDMVGCPWRQRRTFQEPVALGEKRR